MANAIWRVNVNNQTITTEPIPESWQRLGGRALIPRILLDEIPPTCEPLGPFNKLLFVPGLLVGHMLSSCDRISVGSKSPLTGGIKESNAGGTIGLKIARLGMKSLIIEGVPANEGWWTLYLNKDGGRFESADELIGLGVQDSATCLREQYGEKVALALIGPAGEMLMASAGIQNLDKDGNPTRIAARGGLGAVMGSKRLKAIVIDATDTTAPPLTDEELYKDAKNRYIKSLLAHPQTKVYSDYGTVAVAMMAQEFGALPTRNFSEGQFEHIEKINGDTIRDTILARGGEGQTTHACMAGCVIRSSNCFPDPNGKKMVTPLEYETVGMVGSNLGIDSLDTIAKLNNEMNDLGIDSIEIGAALGVAVEAGLMEFGDGDRAMELVNEIRQGTPLGRILGQGASAVGKVYSVIRVPTVKGQAFSAYDPRALKGTGITYATSPQGADHTCGLTIRAQVDHLSPKGHKKVSLGAQINMAGFDTLGSCLFAGFGYATAPGAIRDLLRGQYGWDLGEDALQVLGRQTLDLEREFNKAAGFTRADDRLPEWMTIEPLPPTNAVFDVSEEDLDGVFS
ncbi:aldehyde ferredoxin oxidoreductase C-terminal domain-containing protein [Anaerolineales bacterium HSG24]|nr:aldehyde ferredoxin oxidoreductase C-terminal domain-containing protein [Anaerolineales bacterium HSG24]